MRMTTRLLSVLLGYAVPGLALADIIHVPADYPTIQDAIDAAIDGDEIIVAPGTYNEIVFINSKTITLRSSDGPEVTTIDGTDLFWTVLTTWSVGPGTVVQGFTVTGGDAVSGEGGGMLIASPSNLAVLDCIFIDNATDPSNGRGGGIYIQSGADSSVSIVGCAFIGNSAENGGGIYSGGGSPTISDCTFIGNNAAHGCGGGVNSSSSDMTFVNCTFIGNWASISSAMPSGGEGRGEADPIRSRSSLTFGFGGAMCSLSSDLTLINCAFIDNAADQKGGAILDNSSSSLSITNCTFTGNSADPEGGAIFKAGSEGLVLNNCILWGNTPDEIVTPQGAGIVRHSDIQGGWSGEGSNNIDADPLFTSDASGEARLGPGSPCIDAGDNTAVPKNVTTDINGNPRMVDDPATEDTGFDKPPIVDMGAYEYGAADCNDNGFPDAEDLFDGTSLDCDQNGIPDECDPDCNENGVPDECDIADGTSLNCNDDFIPDECEPDCNENTQADSCDIADGTSWDCNRNAIPDECDVASGEAEDCNENGIPDSCEVIGPDPADSRPINTNAPFQSGWDTSSQVSTDAQGHWVVVWESSDDLDGTIGGDTDILVSRSTNNGATWTSPEPLNAYAPSDTSPDWYPALGTDGAGTWLVSWQSSHDLNGMIGGDWDILFSRSTDNGITWSEPAPVNSNAGFDSGNDWEPELATDGAGNWVIVWRSNDDLDGTIGTDLDILFSRSTDNGATWSTVQPLNANANSGGDSHDFQPQVTTDNAGNWVVAWRSLTDLDGELGTDADILFSRSTDNGASWSYPAALNANAADDSGWDSSPELATDGAGQWVAVWHSSDSLDGTIGSDYDILFSRSSDAGATWAYPMPLNTNAAVNSEADEFPIVTTDGIGNWVALWWSEEDFDYDIMFAHSTDNGASWTDPAPLNTNAASDVGNDVEAQIATDGLGNWVATWSSSELLEGEVVIDFDILFTRFRLTAVDCSGNGIPDECEPDCNENDQADSCDIVDGTSQDCNESAVPDECEIASGDSADCNENSIPDECEGDCNGNGQPDDCDVIEGFSEDCNDNIVPDECEVDCNDSGQPDDCDVADGSSEDCNSNNIPDECDLDCNENGQPDDCDIADGFSADCSGNGIPDECEPDCNRNNEADSCDIADGSSGDCNGNGIPDECPGEPPGPPITQQPVSQEVEVGEFAFFQVQADGGLLEYQWRKDRVDLIDSERILGSQATLLIIIDVVPEDAGEYDCVVTSVFPSGCSTSDTATLTVTAGCPADMNDDGVVGPVDLAMLLAAWGPCADSADCPADLNADAAVGPLDLAQLLAAWGECP